LKPVILAAFAPNSAWLVWFHQKRSSRLQL